MIDVFRATCSLDLIQLIVALDCTQWRTITVNINQCVIGYI